MADVVVDSVAVSSLVVVPSLAYTGAPSVQSVPALAATRGDYQLGLLGKGIGRLRSTVKEKINGTEVPVSRRVRLIRERDGLVVREQWSDATTGAYDFQYIDELETWTVLSYDHTHDFQAVANDNLSLANGVVELMP